MWSHLIIPSIHFSFFDSSIPFQSWLKSHCKSPLLHMSGIPWSIIFPLGCWTVWLNHNIISNLIPLWTIWILDFLPLRPQDVLACVTQWFFIVYNVGSGQGYCEKLIGWDPPLVESVKVNMDRGVDLFWQVFNPILARAPLWQQSYGVWGTD